MKILAIALCIVAAVAGTSLRHAQSDLVKLPLDMEGRGQEEIGPIDNFTCPTNGAFPHEDCRLFILCWEDNAVLHECTDVMLFDLRYNGCNHAEYVDCGSRYRPPDYPGTITPPMTTTTQNSSIPTTSSTPPPDGSFECPNNGVFPHQEKCEYYWSCFEGVANLIHCELDYLFDLRYNGCNFPEYVDCGERERPEGAPPTVTPPVTTRPPVTGTTEPGGNPTPTGNPGDFQCPEPDGTFPDPDDCQGFYVCVENIPIHSLCADGLHFNPDLGLCDWPESAGCEVAKRAAFKILYG